MKQIIILDIIIGILLKSTSALLEQMNKTREESHDFSCIFTHISNALDDTNEIVITKFSPLQLQLLLELGQTTVYYHIRTYYSSASSKACSINVQALRKCPCIAESKTQPSQRQQVTG